MFIIIGGDGKEYGPVNTEQVRGWMAAGRANLDTKAKALGSEEWRRLGDYAEFSPSPDAPPIMNAPEPAFGAPGPAIEVPSASLGLRFGAALIDGILKTLCWLPAGMAVWRVVGPDIMAGLQPSVASLMAAMNGAVFRALPFLVVLAIVQGVLLTARGQSIGKMLIGLRIIRLEDGTRAGFLHAFLLRGTLPWMIEQIPLLGGVFWLVDVCFIFGADRRCVHDYMAGTKVVKA